MPLQSKPKDGTPVTLWIDGKQVPGDFMIYDPDGCDPFNKWKDDVPKQDIPSFQDYIQKLAGTMPGDGYHWPKRKGRVDTIDIDHEVIEPKQLPGHEKEQD